MQKLVRFFVFIDNLFAKIVGNLLIFMLLSMTLLVAAQVVLRNFFNSGISWADVAARHSVMWVAFLGAMLATRSRQHIAIDILTRFIPRKPKNIVRIFLDLFACIAAYYLASASWAFVLEERDMGTELFLGIPTWTAQTIIPFGFIMISLEYAIGIFLDVWRIVTCDPGHEAGRGRE